jgi:hypothetical protein
MTKQLYLAALIIGMAAATPAQAGWFSFGGIMGTGSGDSGFGTKQIAGHQETQPKVHKTRHLVAAGKNENASFVAPTKSASGK